MIHAVITLSVKSSWPCMSLQDKSWRVRYNVAQQLTSLCEALGPELSRCALAPCHPNTSAWQPRKNSVREARSWHCCSFVTSLGLNYRVFKAVRICASSCSQLHQSLLVSLMWTGNTPGDAVPQWYASTLLQHCGISRQCHFNKQAETVMRAGRSWCRRSCGCCRTTRRRYAWRRRPRSPPSARSSTTRPSSPRSCRASRSCPRTPASAPSYPHPVDARLNW